MRVSRLLCGANGTPPKKKNTKSPLKNRRTCFPRNLPIKFSFRGSTGTSRQHGANVTDSVSGAYAGKSTHHHHDYSFHHTPFDEPPSHKHIYIKFTFVVVVVWRWIIISTSNDRCTMCLVISSPLFCIIVIMYLSFMPLLLLMTPAHNHLLQFTHSTPMMAMIV